MTMKTAEREPVTAWIDAPDRWRLFDLAREHDRSVSAELRRAIAAHVRDSDSSETAGVNDERGRRSAS
jgi:hypothetical protein